MEKYFWARTTSLMVAFASWSYGAENATAGQWKVGTPIVTYWAGPAMTDAAATQMAEGGWNVVWCGEKDLDVVRRHGMRAQLQDGLLNAGTVENPAQREKLDALIARVKGHPALYSYFITDEPNAKDFEKLGKLVAYLRERDPAHLAYINLFPTYANNDQLGNKGDKVTAYKEHLDQYVERVKPGLISYDHYQFAVNGDTPDYFLNLAMIRRSAQQVGLPFLNIVQACTWSPGMRVPNGNEMRYLVYTTLGYGAQGISYYVYCCAGHKGAIANADGTPTPLYHDLKVLNRLFVAIAEELQPLRSLAIYHTGMSPLPPGAEALPKDGRFILDPPVAATEFKPLQPVKGIMIGYFGPTETGAATHALVVNLDYKADVSVGLRGPGALEVFDATTGKWAKGTENRVGLTLLPGGGRLVRTK